MSCLPSSVSSFTLNNLPIHEALPEVISALRQHRNVVLQAPPGAGKSTGVPLALLDAGSVAGKILMLEPRRLAARSVATRMAATLGEAVGQTVGYRTRLDTRVSARTRIEIVTEGILTRMLQSDADLRDVGIVIFDEYHERSLQADLGLALCLEVQSTLRDDLKLLVMSATLDGAAVATLLGNAPIINSRGQAFPVVTTYRSNAAAQQKHWQNDDVAHRVAQLIQKALNEETGDMLVFLPGQGEIRRAQSMLQAAALPQHIQILPLYGELLAAEQDRAIQPSQPGFRKIVLATNIAETSLTIEGVRIVIDCGLERRARFDPVTGMNRLETLRISRASAEQRRGRAGRTQSGVCYRLWQESEQSLLQAHTPPEILESDLAPLALELAAWGTTDSQQLRFMDMPPAAHFEQARELLRLLGALDSAGRITAHGRAMSQLATHPRLAHLLLKAREFNLSSLGADIAALLTERDILRSQTHAHHRDVDLRNRIEALHGAMIAYHEVDHAGRQRAQRTSDQLLRQLRASRDNSLMSIQHTGKLLAMAYPDRIAQKRRDATASTAGRYLLSNGRGAILTQPQSVSESEYLVVAQLDAGEREASIQLAAPVEADELFSLFADEIIDLPRIEWDSRDGVVIAQQERRLGSLIIQVRKLDQPDASLMLAALMQGIRELGLSSLPWSAAALALRTRIEFAFQHDKHASWPDVTDSRLFAELDQWLAPWLNGITRRSQLNQLDMHAILMSLLDWNQQQRLDEIAPTHLLVPSGSRIPLDYSNGTPTLSVRLQEVFGMHATPRIGGGTVPVVMELLSPARRPVQVTQDLASFWARGYHDVKKDLKGRYPKHFWPDDPLQAQATARAKPRGT